MLNHRPQEIQGQENWRAARLIPTSGIRGADEQEKRATSALLAVMTAVPDFSRELLRRFGAPGARPQTYIEVEHRNPAGQKVCPDGAIIVRRGSNTWQAFVEVKTQQNPLIKEQVQQYLDLAREQGFDGVLTISNQLLAPNSPHPSGVTLHGKSKLKLWHLAWYEILSAALVVAEHKQISDPEQDWILRELIAYLQHESSGILQLPDMGANWAAVRDAAREGTLHPKDAGAADVVQRWNEFGTYLSLRLSAELGADVTLQPPTGAELAHLCSAKELNLTLRVKNAAGPLRLTANLQARRISASLTVDAPKDGRPKTRINWLVRQLLAAPETATVEAFYGRNKSSIPRRLAELRIDPALLLLEDQARSPQAFCVATARNMGTKRGGETGSFLGDAVTLVHDFYYDVAQRVKPWMMPVPQLAQPASAAAPASATGEATAAGEEHAATLEPLQPPT